MSHPKNELLKRVRSIFSLQNSSKKEEKPLKGHAQRLNFFLLNAALKYIQKGNREKPLSLFTSKILNSKSHHFEALIKQAESVCSKQDIELFSYKEFFSRNQFALRRAVQWKFSKYLKTNEEVKALIHKMNESSPETFKKHLITLLKGEDLSMEEISKEANRLEGEWKVYQQGQGRS
ncbi:MAG: hypothetical protein KDK76_07515, partial [Chlamydiia bacterium]|nr:hypothetical protein [Chlamydiia bacterium]